MIRLIIFALLVFFLYRALKSWIFKDIKSVESEDQAGGVQKIDDVMVKDPYCEIYFPKRDAVRLKQSGQTLYFCSETCKQNYMADEPKTKDHPAD